MSTFATGRGHFPTRVPTPVPATALLALAAGGVGALAAALLSGASTKVVVALAGAAVIAGIAVLSRHRREVLLALTIVLIPIEVETYQDVHTHTGGAPGLVITVQMVLLIPLVVIAILEAVGGSRAGERGRLPRGAIVVPLLPLLLALPSLFHSRALELSWYELLRMFVYVLLYLYFALTFRRSDLPLIVASLLIGVLLELPFAALELVKPGTQIMIGGQDSGSVLESVGDDASLSRVSGTLPHPNFLGGYLSLVLPIAMVGALARGFAPWVRRLSWATLLGGGLMLVLTFSRGSWIGFAAAVPVVLVTAALRGVMRPSRVVFLLVAMVVAGAVLVALPPVTERLFESDPANVSFRFDISNVAIAMWQSEPVIGVGLNTFVENSVAFDYAESALQGLPVHNVYLLWLAETGVVGLAGLALYVLWMLARTWDATRVEEGLGMLLAIGFLGGIVAIYAGETASFSTRIDAVMQAMAVMLGVVVGLRRRGAPRAPSS